MFGNRKLRKKIEEQEKALNNLRKTVDQQDLKFTDLKKEVAALKKVTVQKIKKQIPDSDNSHVHQKESLKLIYWSDLQSNDSFSSQVFLMKRRLAAIDTLYKDKKSHEASMFLLLKEYVETIDFNGEADGHIHKPEELITACVVKRDEKLYEKLLTDLSFRNSVLDNPLFQDIANTFIEIHNKIAHFGH